MNFEEAFKFADTAVWEKTGEHLKHLERIVFEGAWQDQDYSEIAKNNGYEHDTIKGAGKTLWDKLSKALGEKVSKKNFKTALEFRGRSLSTSPTPHPSPDSVSQATSTESLGLQLEEVVDSSELDSTFYVERPPIESECCTAIEKPGALIRIKAPQQMGKTLLLERILAHAREQDYQTVILSFETDSTVFNDLEKFSRWFCASVGKRLELPNKLAEYWDDIFGCNANSTAYFEEYLLAELTNPLVLALDKVDRVFEHSVIAKDFCALLRGWNDQAKQSDKSGAIWKKLRLVVVHSTEVYGSLDINRSPLANVGKIFPLPEFTIDQVQDLARHYGLDWVGNQEVEQLMAMVGGHPYLIQQAFDYIERHNVKLEEFLQIAPTEESPFSAHLREHLGNLQRNPELATAFGVVVTKNQSVRIETAHAFKLHSMGLVKLQGNDCSPRCELYRQYFSVRLVTA